MSDTSETAVNFAIRIPDDEDDQERRICNTCGFIDYQNPKLVVGSVVRHRGQILLCRRAIEPRKGFWTIPAGYLELGESPLEGALREAREEANADLTIHSVLAIYSIRRLSQVQIIHRADLAHPDFSPGPESLDVELFHWADIPWQDIAFPSVIWALNHDREAAAGAALAPFTNPDGETGDNFPSSGESP